MNIFGNSPFIRIEFSAHPDLPPVEWIQTSCIVQDKVWQKRNLTTSWNSGVCFTGGEILVLSQRERERERERNWVVKSLHTAQQCWSGVCVCVNIFAVYPPEKCPITTTERGCNLFTRDILFCWGQFVGTSQHIMDCVLVWSAVFVLGCFSHFAHCW